MTSFLVLSWLTVAASGYVTYLRSRSDLQQAVLDRLDVAANLKADALRDWIAQQAGDLEILSETPTVRRRSAAAVASEPSPEQDAARRDLSQLFNSLVSPRDTWRSEWEEVLLLSDESEIRLSTQPSHEGDYRIRDRFFTEGMKGTWIETVYPSPLTHKPTITVSTPVRDESDEVVGVLAVHLNLEIMDSVLLERTGIGLSSESYLVDRFSIFLSGMRFGNSQALQANSVGIESALQKINGSSAYLDYQGLPVLGAYRWIEEMGLALMIEIPESEALAPARRSSAVILAVGLAGAAFLGFGVWILARRIAHPILEITQAARGLADGRLDLRAPVLTEDEIGHLADTFNNMAAGLESLYSELELRHHELETQSAELRKHRDDLQAANQELNHIAFTVSHDLKNPLVTIRGFLGLVERDLAAGKIDRVHEDIARILAATEHMRRLLDELLEFSRIGRKKNPPEEVELDTLLREVQETVYGDLENVGAVVEVSDSLGVVWGDRIRIFQVFQNLLANAARYMGDQQAPRIEVDACPRGDFLLCQVQDNGAGIDPQYHRKIFGMFERLENETDGTGIGLALVQRIVEIHGGEIWVESEGVPGAGSTFFFTLPTPGVALP